MATNTFTSAASNITDADFRTWGLGLSTAMAAVGMVKTSDTGQINWTTVVKPAASGTYQGYEIWRFNDSLQSTYPLFFKIEYGSSTSATVPVVRISLGKGSDGAGVLTSIIFTNLIAASSSSSSTPTSSYVSSGDGSMLCVGAWPTTQPLMFAIERARDTAGNPAGYAVHLTRSASGSGHLKSISVYSTATAYCASVGTSLGVPDSASLISGGRAPMFPMLLMDGQGHFWQSKAYLGYVIGDAAYGVPVTVSGWGTYMPAWPVFVSSVCSAAIAWY